MGRAPRHEDGASRPARSRLLARRLLGGPLVALLDEPGGLGVEGRDGLGQLEPRLLALLVEPLEVPDPPLPQDAARRCRRGGCAGRRCPAIAICTDLRVNPGMIDPGIWKSLTSSVIARIVWFGESSSAAWMRLR